jgi:hypothetical protein
MVPRLLLVAVLLIAFAAATGTGVAAPLPTGEWWLQAETTDDAGIVRDGSDAAALWL